MFTKLTEYFKIIFYNFILLLFYTCFINFLGRKLNKEITLRMTKAYLCEYFKFNYEIGIYYLYLMSTIECLCYC